MFAHTPMNDCSKVSLKLVMVAALVAVMPPACNKKEEKKKADPAAVAADKAAKKPTVAGQAANAAGGGDCAAYSKALCGLAGDGSATCASIKTTLKLLPPAACKAGMGDLEYSKKELSKLSKPCDDLIAKLCKDLGPETQTCAMVKSKTPQFGSERCTQMMGNYPKVLGQLKQMEAANKPLSPEKMAKIAAPGGCESGPKDAKVTIVEPVARSGDKTEQHLRNH